VSPVSSGDRLVLISSHLRPEEAGMLRGLLESAGIVAVVRDDVLSGVNPFLQPAIGGAKLAVRAEDEARAREIVAAAGVLPGAPGDEPVEIPEEEWSRPAQREITGARPPGAASPRRLLVTAGAVGLAAVLLWRCAAGS
jgi:hypothetical protein